jgi:hypothetical protein
MKESKEIKFIKDFIKQIEKDFGFFHNDQITIANHNIDYKPLFYMYSNAKDIIERQGTDKIIL